MAESSSSQPPLPLKAEPFHSQLPPGTYSVVHSLPKKQQQPEIIDLTSDHDDPQSTHEQRESKRKHKREKRSKSKNRSHKEQAQQQKRQRYIQRDESSQLRSQPRDQTIVSSAFNTFYSGFLERGKAEEYLKKFDSLCETYYDSEESMDITELKSLEARIHEFRIGYQETIKCCKKDEHVAWHKLYDTIFKQFSQTYYSSHYDTLIQKIDEFKDHLSDYLTNREQREWVDQRCNVNDLLRQKHAIHSLEKRHNTRTNYLKQNIHQELNTKQQLYLDEQNKSLEESQQLYNYVEKRISIEIKKLVPSIGDDVVRDLCQQVIVDSQLNEHRKMECIVNDAITQLQRKRHNKLQGIINDYQENFHHIEETTKTMDKLKDAQIKVEEIEKKCSGEKFETVDDIRIKIEYLEQQVHDVLQRRKRLREEQNLVTTERKKNRLEVVEKNLDELQSKLDQAEQDVLLPNFPLRIKESIHEVYGILNNHGEFLRHIIDPVAAEKGEMIGQKQLDKISALQDGLTFPLLCSIEKLANHAAHRVFSNAEERLDVLEKNLD